MYYDSRTKTIVGLFPGNLLSPLQQFAGLLPRIVLEARKLTSDPLWSTHIPFETPAYGRAACMPSPDNKPDLGGNPKLHSYIFAADMVLTAEGFQVVEVDCVPNGRGVLLSLLPDDRRQKAVDAFLRYYRTAGWSEIVYATGTGALPHDTAFFCETMHTAGINIRAVDINETVASLAHGTIIERLFMRDEITDATMTALAGPDHLVTPSEPWLDSKAMPAAMLGANLGLQPEQVRILRSLIPATYPLPRDVTGKNTMLAAMTDVWGGRNAVVLKVSEVEDHTSWGAHGVVLGSSLNGNRFSEILSEARFGGNTRCVVQRKCASIDFRSIWEPAIAQGYTGPLGLAWQPPTLKPNTVISGRIRVFFLISGDRCKLLPSALVNLRPNELVHGASDSIFLAAPLE